MLPAWDLWRLEDSVGLRKTHTARTLENMLRTFNLNCNAIALNLGTGVLTDAAGSVRQKHVGFVPNAIVHSEPTFAAKALVSHLRFSWPICSDVQSFVSKHLDHAALLHEALKVFPGLSLLSGGPAESQQLLVNDGTTSGCRNPM
jgi:hypothetical protein